MASTFIGNDPKNDFRAKMIKIKMTSQASQLTELKLGEVDNMIYRVINDNELDPSRLRSCISPGNNVINDFDSFVFQLINMKKKYPYMRTYVSATFNFSKAHKIPKNYYVTHSNYIILIHKNIITLPETFMYADEVAKFICYLNNPTSVTKTAQELISQFISPKNNLFNYNALFDKLKNITIHLT